MGHAGASRKPSNDAPWETLGLRLSRPISAPLLTVALSWRYEEQYIELPPPVGIRNSTPVHEKC